MPNNTTMAGNRSIVAPLEVYHPYGGARGSADYSSPYRVILLVLFFLWSCKTMHNFLTRFGQPRLISELLVGAVVGNVAHWRGMVESYGLDGGFRLMEGFSSALYMFVLGLEMEPAGILLVVEARIALAGVAVTVAVFTGLYAIFIGVKAAHSLVVLFAYAVTYAAASSPIIIRLITELKLGQSEIGRRAIRAALANDLICTAVMGVLLGVNDSALEGAVAAAWVAGEMLFVAVGLKQILRWVNRRNPEGKPLRGLDTTLVIVVTQVLCHSADFFHYDAKVNAFLVGLAMPREGRVSNFLISKINYVLNTFVLPLYIVVAGSKAGFSGVAASVAKRGMNSHVVKICIVSALAAVAKLAATFAFSYFSGLHWLEGFTLAVLLNMRGYYQIFFSMHARQRGLMDEGTFFVTLILVFMSIVFVPAAVSTIVRHARKISGRQPGQSNIQWQSKEKELRLAIGLHGPHNVPATMNLIEALRAGSDAATVVVYATDMIELTEQTKASLVYSQGTNSVMVSDPEVMEQREQIGASLDAHMEAGAEQGTLNVLTLQRTLAVSAFTDMHDDICCTAQDCLCALVILPFHRSQKPDGTMDSGHVGFRTVNENVLRHAPCSVGILVDRGLGHNGNLSALDALMSVAVLFIGGADDREALACAGIISRHPAVRLTVIRLLPEAMAAEGTGRTIFTAMPHRKKEMEEDDEYFAGFYDEHVTTGAVGYMEKHVKEGAEAVTMLRELEDDYQLFIVGQGSQRNSVLTAGLSEWAEFPELGPIGDVLAASDFPLNASVLIIQQFNTNMSSEYANEDLFGS